MDLVIKLLHLAYRVVLLIEELLHGSTLIVILSDISIIYSNNLKDLLFLVFLGFLRGIVDWASLANHELVILVRHLSPLQSVNNVFFFQVCHS